MGNLAGETNQPERSIILNATGAAINGTDPSAVYIAPIRPSTNSYNGGSIEIKAEYYGGKTVTTSIGDLALVGTSFTLEAWVKLNYKHSSSSDSRNYMRIFECAKEDGGYTCYLSASNVSSTLKFYDGSTTVTSTGTITYLSLIHI